jgi:hypothetical protein
MAIAEDRLVHTVSRHRASTGVLVVVLCCLLVAVVYACSAKVRPTCCAPLGLTCTP